MPIIFPMPYASYVALFYYFTFCAVIFLTCLEDKQKMISNIGIVVRNHFTPSYIFIRFTKKKLPPVANERIKKIIFGTSILGSTLQFTIVCGGPVYVNYLLFKANFYFLCITVNGDIQPKMFFPINFLTYSCAKTRPNIK